jgi:hypothetical protein
MSKYTCIEIKIDMVARLFAEYTVSKIAPVYRYPLNDILKWKSKLKLARKQLQISTIGVRG